MMRALTLSLAIVAVAQAAPAAAASYSDILGRWCGDRSNKYVTTLHFMRNSFSVTWSDTNRRREHRIIRYEFHPSSVKVHWFSGGRRTWTEYGGFTRDGRSMLQLPNRAGPTYIFYRC